MFCSVLLGSVHFKQLACTDNLSSDILGMFGDRQQSNSAAARRFFSDLSKESVAKQIAIGGAAGWYVCVRVRKLLVTFSVLP